jgi:hypothetical protein
MKLLNTTNSNTKIAKTQKMSEAIRVASMSLMPHPLICAGSKAAGCFEDCLKSSGRGVFESVAKSRQNKTWFWLNDQAGFLTQLAAELHNFEKLCARQNVAGWVRLNTISDIDWENYGIPQAFPNLNFYDYTKRVNRFKNLPDNYRLILSYSGRRQYAKTVAARPAGAPMAVVFGGDGLPEYWNGERVIDGDVSDLINLASGCIVGLRAKGKAKTNDNDFVVYPDIIPAMAVA